MRLKRVEQLTSLTTYILGQHLRGSQMLPAHPLDLKQKLTDSELQKLCLSVFGFERCCHLIASKLSTGAATVLVPKLSEARILYDPRM